MDILLLIILAVGFIVGLNMGAVKQIFSFLAFAIGFVVACLFYQQLGGMLDGILSMPSFSKALAFVLLWCLVLIIAKLVASLLSSVLNKLPVIGIANRLLGGILGVAKYAFVLGAFIWLFSSVHLIKEETMQSSRLCLPLKALPESVYNILKGS